MKRQIVQQEDSVDTELKKLMESFGDINLILTNDITFQMLMVDDFFL